MTMAKVMISIPDELLADVDERAREQGTSRSGLLQRLAERDLSLREEKRDLLVKRLLGKPGHYGGGDAGAVRELRRAR